MDVLANVRDLFDKLREVDTATDEGPATAILMAIYEAVNRPQRIMRLEVNLVGTDIINDHVTGDLKQLKKENIFHLNTVFEYAPVYRPSPYTIRGDAPNRMKYLTLKFIARLVEIAPPSLGRCLIHRYVQAMADRRDYTALQEMVIDHLYWPTFKIVDRMYGWLHYDKDMIRLTGKRGKDAIAPEDRTRAKRAYSGGFDARYQPYLFDGVFSAEDNVRLSYKLTATTPRGTPEYAAAVKKNQAARTRERKKINDLSTAEVNAYWATPMMWATNRTRWLMESGAGDDALRAPYVMVHDALLRRLELVGTGETHVPGLRFETLATVIGPRCQRAHFRAALAARLESVCYDGSPDPAAIPVIVLGADIAAVDTLGAWMQSFVLVFAFVVDYARVAGLAIVLDASLLEKLGLAHVPPRGVSAALLTTVQSVSEKLASVMPRPMPFFTHRGDWAMAFPGPKQTDYTETRVASSLDASKRRWRMKHHIPTEFTPGTIDLPAAEMWLQLDGDIGYALAYGGADLSRIETQVSFYVQTLGMADGALRVAAGSTYWPEAMADDRFAWNERLGISPVIRPSPHVRSSARQLAITVQPGPSVTRLRLLTLLQSLADRSPAMGIINVRIHAVTFDVYDLAERTARGWLYLAHAASPATEAEARRVNRLPIEAKIPWFRPPDVLCKEETAWLNARYKRAHPLDSLDESLEDFVGYKEYVDMALKLMDNHRIVDQHDHGVGAFWAPPLAWAYNRLLHYVADYDGAYADRIVEAIVAPFHAALFHRKTLHDTEFHLKDVGLRGLIGMEVARLKDTMDPNYTRDNHAALVEVLRRGDYAGHTAIGTLTVFVLDVDAVRVVGNEELAATLLKIVVNYVIEYAQLKRRLVKLTAALAKALGVLNAPYENRQGIMSPGATLEPATLCQPQQPLPWFYRVAGSDDLLLLPVDPIPRAIRTVTIEPAAATAAATAALPNDASPWAAKDWYKDEAWKATVATTAPWLADPAPSYYVAL